MKNIKKREEIFKNAAYIKAKKLENTMFSYNDPAPLFRKEFIVEDFEKAEIYVQCPGVAHFYLNGQEITEDKFLSPWSDYNKILWYTAYDVSRLLKKGRNILAVIVGNGWYNESFETPWGHNCATWRDSPKFILELRVNDEVLVCSDETWRCSEDSFIVYNQFRSGEWFDARKYKDNWKEIGFDDKEWLPVIVDDNPPKGLFKLHQAEPIREVETFYPKKIYKTECGYTIDFGENISGYIQIAFQQKVGSEITLRYTEEIDENYHPKYNELRMFYKDIPFQECKMICSGNRDLYKPYFVYFGFRYVEIEGIDVLPEEITAYFVHQDISRTSHFLSSDKLLNFIYNAGIRSTYSNMFYCLTDCPTREKLGWLNDAQASIGQVLFNFDSVAFFKKWFEDLKGSMYDNGALPAVIPAVGTSWELGWGPVCDYFLFELPLQIYRYTGRKDFLIEAIPYFKRYYEFLNETLNEGREFTLGDWMGWRNNPDIPVRFILDAYRIKAAQTIALAEKLNGSLNKDSLQLFENIAIKFQEDYLDENGRCIIDEQTAVAMLLCMDISIDKEPLKKQLLSILDRDKYVLKCGMVGTQYIYDALTKSGNAEIAYRLIAQSNPGYKNWYNYGATSLWERMDGENWGSHNHHMFSHIITWFYTSLLGINICLEKPGFEKIDLKPNFIQELDFCEGKIKTPYGDIFARWERDVKKVKYVVEIPNAIEAYYKGSRLSGGKNTFFE